MSRCELCDYSPDCESIYNSSLLPIDQAGGEPRFRSDYGMCLCRCCYQSILKSNLALEKDDTTDDALYEIDSYEELEGIIEAPKDDFQDSE